MESVMSSFHNHDERSNMERHPHCLFTALAGIALAMAAVQSQGAQPETGVPHLSRQGMATQLIVDGKPFLALAGELSNSSASSPAYMKPIWPRLVATRFNTVLATVSWELIEPEEGRFDFALVDDLLRDARENNMRLVLLWFGSWKNGKSTYQPLWIKTNQAKYPLVQNQEGHGLPTLSTFSEANREADARAFAALMRHLRLVDGSKHTVIMMQVENEVGVLDTPRDYCPAANQAFNGPVPKDLMDYLQAHKLELAQAPQLLDAWQRAGFKTSGTWEEVFGKSTVNKQDWHAFSYLTEEIFMAWNYARYVGRVAAAGKAEYDIPMYVNTWIKQQNSGWPGAYPSGGAQPQVIMIWQAGAPAIDIRSPDIYAPNFTEWCNWYTQPGNPLFIPESGGDARGAAHALWAFGHLDAIGYSPFGVDRSTGADSALGRAYDVMSQVAPLILEHQGNGTMNAVLLDGSAASQTIRLGNYNLQARLSSSRNSTAAAAQPDRVAALFICTGPDDYVIVAQNVNIYFTAATNPSDSVGLATVEEGVYADGKWIPGRRLNGDETPEWKALKFRGETYTIQHVKLYRYH
jgi:beta-galactosidase GanA